MTRSSSLRRSFEPIPTVVGGAGLGGDLRLTFASKTSYLVLLVSFLAIFIAFFNSNARTIDALAANLQNGSYSQSEVVGLARQKHFDGFFEKVASLNIRHPEGPVIADERHKMRWLYKTVEASVYRYVADHQGAKAAHMLRVLHSTAYLMLTLVMTFLIMTRISGRNSGNFVAVSAAVFFAWFTFTNIINFTREEFTFVETFCIAAGVYFSLNRRLVLFLLILLLAVSNRETGAGFGMIYFIINWRSPLFWLPLITGPILLMAINADLFGPYFQHYISVLLAPDKAKPTVFDFWTYPALMVVKSMLQLAVLLIPIAAVIWKAWGYPGAGRLGLITLIYLLVLLRGAPINNVFPYLLLLPLVLGFGAMVIKKSDDADAKAA
jgi:hypothetical protein